MKKQITTFINEFEKGFQGVLVPVQHKEKGAEYTKHFKIFPGKKKYSDWDLHCFVNRNKISKTILQKMESFTRAYSAFSCVTWCRPIIEKNFEKILFLQLAGFVKEESFAPFFDLHIECVPLKLLNHLRRERRKNEEFVSWCIMTCWRKLNKQDPSYGLGMLSYLLLPALTNEQ